MISWVDLTPTILDMAQVEIKENSLHGRSFKEVLNVKEPQGWDQIYASHTFHEITMYYPMRVVRDKNFKLIRNIAWRLEYPFASDLWAASTWQEVHRGQKEFYGNRKVKDYLYRPEFELFDLEKDPGEIVNLANDPAYREVLDTMIKKMKDFQIKTKDPWLITWDHDDSLQGKGINL
jgi:N-sulfoglucosamine sulfohydrolase